jgi:hypothetical protein
MPGTEIRHDAQFTDDFAEAQAALREHREPRFTGH